MRQWRQLKPERETAQADLEKVARTNDAHNKKWEEER